MKVLYFNDQAEDYLADSIFHGLKELDEVEVYEYPQKHIMYADYKGDDIRGHGFTLYKTIDKQFRNPREICPILNLEKFDLVVFSNIHRQVGLLCEYYKQLDVKKTILLDGEDHEAIFPFRGDHLRNPLYVTLPKMLHKRFLYLKREFTPKSIRYTYLNLIGNSFSKYFYDKSSIKPVSFSIPSGKIVDSIPNKEKTFTEHIVDEEIRTKLNKGSENYKFSNEADYYSDLQKSKFGITTKRAGWDALRHYEITANGAVLCFKDLDLKPESCAPHDLRHGINCLIYKNYEHLMQLISNIDDSAYEKLALGSLEWVRSKTTKHLALYLLNTLKEFHS